jgi:hypothetical protein
MYARTVFLRLRPDAGAEFTRIIEDEILPLLRAQNGFEHEITLVTPEGRDAVAISLWDHKESAELYNDAAYPQVLKHLGKLAEGTPDVRGYEVANASFQKVPAVG